MSKWHKPDPPEKLLYELVELQKETLHVSKKILQVELANMGYLQEIVRELLPKTLSRSAAVIFSGASHMANTLALNVGQSSTATPVTFLADGVTPAGATISAVTWTFSDPSATLTPDADGITATITGVAAGTATGSVAFTATDTDSAVSTWTASFTVTTSVVVPPPPTQLSQSAGVTFSTPTP